MSEEDTFRILKRRPLAEVTREYNIFRSKWKGNYPATENIKFIESMGWKWTDYLEQFRAGDKSVFNQND